jgi:hypothetical protein
MKKISTMQVFSNEILQEQKLTIGVDLGDRWSFYCVLEEAAKSGRSTYGMRTPLAPSKYRSQRVWMEGWRQGRPS